MLLESVIAVVLTISTLCGATSNVFNAPKLASVHFGRSSGIIPDEGAAWDQFTAYDGPNGRYATNTSTANGWYKELQLADTKNISNGKLYFIFPNPTGGLLCHAFTAPMPAPLPPQPSVPAKFVRQTMFDGKLYNVFRLTSGQVVTTLYFEADPVGNTTGIMAADVEGMGNMRIGSVVNGSIPASDWFDVPEACQREAVHIDIKEVMVGRSVLDGLISGGHDVSTPSSAIREVYRLKATLVDKSMLFRASPEEIRNVPPSLDNRRYATPIRNQGACGGCWAFASAASTEIARNVAANRTFPEPEKAASQWLSPQNLIDCAHELPGKNLGFACMGCMGGNPMIAMNWIVEHGIALDTDYTFDAANGRHCKSQSSPYKLSSMKYIPETNAPSTNVGLIQAGVAKYGAVAIVMNANPLINYRGGVYNDIEACRPSHGHVVTVVGWGTAHPDGKPLDYWLIKNSFGSGWGEAGYLRIARGVNMCGVEQMGFVPIP